LIEEIKERNLKVYSKMNKDELVDMLKTDDLLNTKLVRKNRDQLPLNIDIERLPKEEIAEKIGFKPIESLTLTKDYLSQVTNLKDALVLLSRLLHLVAKDAPTIKKTIDLASSRDNDTGGRDCIKKVEEIYRYNFTWRHTNSVFFYSSSPRNTI